jgi:hypothetical protein
MSATKVCIRCNQEKLLEEFPLKSKLRGTRQTVCKRCTAERSNRWYYENKEAHIKNVRMNTIEYRNEVSQYIWNYFASHPCVDCGETDPVVLEFDHVRAEKFDAVSTMIGAVFHWSESKMKSKNASPLQQLPSQKNCQRSGLVSLEAVIIR